MHKTNFLLISLFVILSIFLAACAGSTDEIGVGNPAPDFSLPAADGRTVSLTDYEGQPVLLYFHMAKG